MINIFYIEERLKNIANNPNEEYFTIKKYLQELITKDNEDIFHPFCVACGIDKKYGKIAWNFLALEMKVYSLGILWNIDKKPEYIVEVRSILKYLIGLYNWSDTYNRRNNVKNTYPETSAIIRAISFAINIFGEVLGYDLHIKTKKRLSYACQRIFEVISKKEVEDLSIWTNDWTLDIGVSLGLAAKILSDFDNRSQNWLNLSKKIVYTFLENMPQDGSHPSGLLTWEYTLYLALFFTHIMELSGEDVEAYYKIIDRAKYYALATSGPLCANTSQFDQSIHISIYNPLNGILSKSLAYYFNDEYIYWGIINSPKKNYFHPFEILLCSNELKPKKPEINSQHYDKAGYVFMRSGWDKDDNLITFKSANSRKPFSHKDQNNFEIFMGDTEMLIESGTCYEGHPNYEMRYLGTHAHNVLLIDNKAQLPKTTKTGGIKKFISNNDFDFVKGDASSVYSKAKTFTRNFLFLKPNILILYDYLELNTLGTVEWLFHTPGSIHIHSLSANKNILFCNDNKYMSMFILEPQRWSYRITKDFILEDWCSMHEKTHDVLRIKATNKIQPFLSIIYFNNDNHEVLPCQYENNIINIIHNDKEFNISTNKNNLLINDKEITDVT